MTDARMMNTLEKDFIEWVYRTTQVMVRANEALKLYAAPGTTEGDFRAQCTEAARDALQADLKKAAAPFDSKLRTLQDRLDREQRELKQDQAKLSSRKLEEGANIAETVAGLFGVGRKRAITSSFTKRRMTSQAKSDVEESEDAIQDLEEQIKQLETEKEAALQAVNDKWAEVASQVTEIPITPQKKDVLLDFFGVAWMPFHLVKTGDQLIELPGFSTK